MKVGIDAINFYTPHYCLDLVTLAAERGLAADNGFTRLAVVPPYEDAVTLAANAALPLLAAIDTNAIELVLFATESGVDTSKAAATYLHDWLNLAPRCRVVELKQACYGATAGLRLALNWVQQHPQQKVLVLGSDIARYKMGVSAELSQGAGAIALLVSANPRIATVHEEAGFCTQETLDFWRPNGLAYALVNGRLSCSAYMHLAMDCFAQYQARSGNKAEDHAYFCYHSPVAKLVERTHLKLTQKFDIQFNWEQILPGLIYDREVGNCYTASLYLGLLSLLENAPEALDGKLLGMYSYGSGSVAEFYGVTVMPGYQHFLPAVKLAAHLATRQVVDIATYQNWREIAANSCENSAILDEQAKLPTYYALHQIIDYQRIYRRVVSA